MADPMIDERLQAVEDKQTAAVQEVENTFGGMAQNADQYFDKQMQATQDWADKQTELQNQQTELTLEQIEQQKAQAGKDYTKEQAGAWADYQKQIAQHGVQAEQMAAAGMTGTGFSESSKVAAYNTYQNRVAAAKASYDQVVMNYNNSMKEARLQNSSVLAEISFNALQKGLELALQGFQYMNQLVTEGLGMKMDVENMYHGQYMDVWNQINTEKAQAEQIRQFDLSHQLDVDALAHQKDQDAQAQKNWQAEFDYGKEQDKQAQSNWQAEFDAAMAQDQRDHEYRVGRDAVEDSHWQQAFDYGKEQDAQAQKNWKAEFDREGAALAKQEALDRAQIMAASGDFSGYKAALGLTDAQVKKLESKYQSEIQTEADAKAYEQKLDRAKVLAAGGDFSGYKELYDLTDEQVKDLEAEFAAGKSALITKDGDPSPLDTFYTDLENAEIDEAILGKLGYGNVSDEELVDLIEDGVLSYSVVDGKMVFKKGEKYTEPPKTEPPGGNQPPITQEEANARLKQVSTALETTPKDNLSLEKLGYGNISQKELIQHYVNGVLEYTTVNGKLIFRKGKNYVDPRVKKDRGSSTAPVGVFDPQVRQ